MEFDQNIRYATMEEIGPAVTFDERVKTLKFVQPIMDFVESMFVAEGISEDRIPAMEAFMFHCMAKGIVDSINYHNRLFHYRQD